MSRSKVSSPKTIFSSSTPSLGFVISSVKRLPSIQEKVPSHSSKKFFLSGTQPFSSKDKAKEPNLLDTPRSDTAKPHRGSLEKKSTLIIKDPDLIKKFSEHILNETPEKKLKISETEGVNPETLENQSSIIYNPKTSNTSALLKNFDSNIESSGLQKSSESNFIHSEQTTLEYYNEIVNVLREKLMNSKKKLNLQISSQQELRALHDKNIEKLTLENRNLEKNLENLNEKLKKSKTAENDLNKEFSDAKLFFQEKLRKSENLIQEYKQEIFEKSREITQLQDLLKRSEINRKLYSEHVKDLEIEVANQKRKYSILEKNLEKLKSEHSQAFLENNQYKLACLNFSEIQQELAHAKEKILTLVNTNDETLASLKSAEEAYNSLKHNYDNAKVNWREKETAYGKMIQELVDQMNIEKSKNFSVNETLKLKRAITLKEADLFLNFNKAELDRFSSSQEEKKPENAFEIEKLRKSLEYYKCLANNKTEIISRLENQIEKNNHLSILDLMVNIKENYLVCQKCGENETVEFLSPCNHHFCNSCQSAHNHCPVCQQPFDEKVVSKSFQVIREVIKELGL